MNALAIFSSTTLSVYDINIYVLKIMFNDQPRNYVHMTSPTPQRAVFQLQALKDALVKENVLLGILTGGRALSGTSSPFTASIHSTSKPVRELARTKASFLSVRSLKPRANTFSN